MPLSASTAFAVALYITAALLPGLAVLRLLRVDVADVTVRLGLAAGLGLALHPLAFLWARTLGVPLGAVAWGALLIVAGAGALWPQRRTGTARTSGVVAASGGVEGAASRRLAGACLAALVGMVLAARWWAVRDLSVPMWGDSVHHAMIVRLFVAQGGLVRSWLPEVPLATFTYHFGLHAGAAGLAWLTGLAPHRALIVAGQTLMVLQVLTAYALAAGLTGRRWAGVGAAVAAAGLSPMPGYYVNWGRYTQLAGQTILPSAALLVAWAAGAPTAAWATWETRATRGARLEADHQVRLANGEVASVAESRRHARLRIGLAAALAVAGLALTHYLVTATFALLAAAWWLVVSIGGRATAGEALRALARLAAVAVAAVAAAGPWLPAMAGGLLFQTAVAVTADAVAPAVYGATSVDALRAGLPQILADHARIRVGGLLLVAAAIGAAWAAVRRERLAATGLAWTALLVVAAYPWLVGLPLGAVLKDFTAAIGMYLPLGLVVGGAFGDIVARASGRWRRAPLVATAVVLLAGGAAAWSGGGPPVVEHQLVTKADEAAIAWVRTNTPPDARFLVSGFMAFGDSVAAGDDAGWWLPQLAERATTLPPITYGLERSVDPGYRAAVNAVYAALPKGPDDPELIALIEARGVTHAFVGATARALDGDALAASPRWREVYAQDGVRVFERRMDG